MWRNLYFHIGTVAFDMLVTVFLTIYYICTQVAQLRRFIRIVNTHNKFKFKGNRFVDVTRITCHVKCRERQKVTDIPVE